jgi:hypothetical protein
MSETIHFPGGRMNRTQNEAQALEMEKKPFEKS